MNIFGYGASIQLLTYMHNAHMATFAVENTITTRDGFLNYESGDKKNKIPIRAKMLVYNCMLE